MSELQVELEGLAGDLGIDLFGAADLTTASDLVRAQGGEHIARFPRAISIGTVSYTHLTLPTKRIV